MLGSFRSFAENYRIKQRVLHQPDLSLSLVMGILSISVCVCVCLCVCMW